MTNSIIVKCSGALLAVAALTVGACGGNGNGSESPAADPAAAARDIPAAEQMAGEPEQPARTTAAFADRLAAASRPAADRERDAKRKPDQVIEFLGIEPGMEVLDVIAAGGYYTEVLSHAVGPEGTVVAQNPPAVLRFRDGANEKEMSERLAGERLPNVRRLDKDFDAMSAADGSFDAALTALNFHDIYNGSGPDRAEQVLRRIGELLRPGGVVGIIDHVGVAGQDNASLHRIEPDKVAETARAAGFEVEARSDLLRSEADDHTLSVFDESVRGNTDRFLLKLRKPSG